MKRLTVAFQRLKRTGGPNIFLRRLRAAFRGRSDVKVTTVLNPFHDISLRRVFGKKYFGKPFCVRLDGIYIDSKNTVRDTQARNGQIASSVNRSAGVIFNARFCKTLAERLIGELPVPYVIAHNGVNTGVFRPDGPSHREAFSRFDVIIVAAAEWRAPKRLDAVITAFQHAAERDWGLLILGSGVPDNLGDPRCISVGWQTPSSLAPWYRTGDLILHLAWIEPFANTCIEAMACGLPLVCSNNGGMREAIDETGFGKVVNTDPDYQYDLVDFYRPPPPRDYDAIASAMHEVLKAKRSGEMTPPLSYLSIDRAAQQYIDFLRQRKEASD